jgi:hypothetical protein
MAAQCKGTLGLVCKTDRDSQAGLGAHQGDSAAGEGRASSTASAGSASGAGMRSHHKMSEAP